MKYEKSPFSLSLWWMYVKCADSIDPLTHNSYYNTNTRNVVGNNSYYNTNPRSVVSNNSHYKYKSEDKFPQQYRSCSMKRKLRVQCFYYCWHRTVTPFFANHYKHSYKCFYHCQQIIIKGAISNSLSLIFGFRIWKSDHPRPSYYSLCGRSFMGRVIITLPHNQSKI